MGFMSSTDPKTENSDSQSQNNQVPSEKLGDSSPELGDSSSSEKLGDSSTVWRDPVESGSPIEESDQPKEGDAEGEEEGECGFCLFMKAGGCKESFTAWEVCVEEAEKNKEDIVTKCTEVTSLLKKCMDAHSDYYQPILAAEKAAEEQVKKELEAEKKISEEEMAAMKLAQG
ncbi:hypothetical protein EUTSA_v10008923mg [Eutrema salsugineum]|uniref:GCK domain-containing protein n=1 Tax=Eutrema salsugineum TaxID=72664 RepID=V4KCG2_EUTSA|nr:uncharacterized protein LOC18993469 [Eutrema salsugineum]ESQ35415.1 hypothetical protein EUTSA_v10008923mg [Eutrema salsugineum]